MLKYNTQPTVLDQCWIFHLFRCNPDVFHQLQQEWFWLNGIGYVSVPNINASKFKSAIGGCQHCETYFASLRAGMLLMLQSEIFSCPSVIASGRRCVTRCGRKADQFDRARITASAQQGMALNCIIPWSREAAIILITEPFTNFEKRLAGTWSPLSTDLSYH